jgi:putative intracellular protease/amidase
MTFCKALTLERLTHQYIYVPASLPEYQTTRTSTHEQLNSTNQHKDKTEAKMSYNPKKILITVSDANEFPLQKGNNGETVSQPSGFFLKELAIPLQKLLDLGYEVTFASPEGKEPKPDPNSESLLTYAGNFYERKRENELIERMKRENGFARPRRFDEISDEELKSFSGVLLPGGHAPLADLGGNKELGRILWHFHEQYKPTAAICHGPYAFLSTRETGKGFAYMGYKLSCCKFFTPQF